MSDDSGQPHDGLGRAHSNIGRPGWSPRYTVAAITATALLSAGIWLSTLVRLSPALRDIALFAHLGFLILGLGTVLVADYIFALWALGRTTFAEALASTSRLHLLIWSGLVGLVVSGALLGPDLTSGLTVLKLTFVATLTLNGVQAMALDKRMRALHGAPPMRLLLWGGLTAAISQISWWGAVFIGYLNVNR